MSELLGQSGRALPAVQPPVCTILGRSRPPAQAMLMFDQPGRAGRSRVPMKDAKGIEKFADEYLVGIIGFIYSALATIFFTFWKPRTIFGRSRDATRDAIRILPSSVALLLYIS